MMNFYGNTSITKVVNRVVHMTVDGFNDEKRRESKDIRLQVRVEPMVEELLRQIKDEHFTDLDFPAFHRMILYDFIRGFLGRDKDAFSACRIHPQGDSHDEH